MRDASGRSKGCGIVEYRTPVEAQQAINTLLDTELKGRLIFVREDREAAGDSTSIEFYKRHRTWVKNETNRARLACCSMLHFLVYGVS